MADKTVKLKILLEAAGIVPTTKQLAALNKEMDKTKTASKTVSTSSNELKRNLEGVGQRSGSTGKDFARMSQGMGGLVQAYATVAANVFALSSAFLVLRKAADLSSMMKSSEDFSNRFGVSVTRITKQMQKASGGALDFAEALPSINKAISAGVGTEQLEQLTIAATKAAQTFGGSATEALSRFISASQRGRVEIIQTLGIIIKTEQAYKDYGATIGKTALELTALDRQQAILTATIAESQNIFDGITIDPNPFQQLLTTITDLKDVMATFITDAATPVIEFFNKSAAFAGVLIAVLVKTVSSRIIPALGDQIIATQVKSVESTRLALLAAQRAKRTAAKFEKEQGKTSTDTSIANIRKNDMEFKKSLGERIKMHKSFTKQIFNQEHQLQVAVLTEQRAAISREIKARAAGKGQQKIFVGTSDAALKKQLNTLNQIGASVENANISVKKLNISLKQTTTQVATFGIKAKAAMAGFKAETARTASLYRTGFAQITLGVNTSLIKSIGRVGRAWGKFAFDVVTFKGATVLGSFGRAAGRTAGLMVATLSKALGTITTLLIIVELARFAWEKWGDSILGISPAQRKVIDASEELESALTEVNNRTAEGIVKLGSNMPQSLKKLQDALKFTTGSFNSITDAIRNFQKAVVLGLGNLTPEESIKKLGGLKKELQDILDQRKVFQQTKNTKGLLELATPESIAKVKELRLGISSIEDVLKTLGDKSLPQFEAALSKAFNLAKIVGFDNVGALLEKELSAALDSGLLSNQFGDFGGAVLGQALSTAFASGDETRITEALVRIKAQFKGSEQEFAVFANGLLNVVSTFNSSISDLSLTTDSALASLKDVNSRIFTFVSGLDKVRASTAPNKEISAFILDINRELISLDNVQKGITKNSKLSELFGNPEELAQVKALLGFNKNLVVDIGQAQVRAASIQEHLILQQQSRLLGAQQLKILSIDLATINSRELKTDKDRVKQVQDRLKVERLITTQSIADANANIVAQQDVIKALTREGATKDELDIRNAELTILEKQRDALIAKGEAQDSSLDVERTTLDIQKDILENTKSQLSAQQKIEASNKNLAESTADYLKASKNIVTLQIKQVANEAALVRIKIARIVLEEKDENLRERGIGLAYLELEALEAQTREILKQDESRRARASEVGGGSVFTQAGMQEIAGFFGRAMQDEVNKLKSSFEILGNGFASTLFSTFDLAVDNLLEGGRDFAKVITEGLKASLREVFGEALKARIKDSLNSLFNIPTQESAAAARHTATMDAMMAANSSRFNLKYATEALTRVMSGKAAGTGGSGTIVSPVFKKGDNSQAGAFNGLLAETKTSANRLDEVKDTNVLGNEIAGTAAAIATGDSKSIMQAVFSLIPVLIAGFTSTATASALGTGGLVKGGLSNITPMAAGGITTGPSLALVGEGKTNEAVVPLPNNKAIPVDLKGDRGGDTINIEQNFDFSNASPDTIGQLRNEARAIEDRTFNRVFTEISKGGRYAKASGRRQ